MEFYEDFEDAQRASETKRILIDTHGRVGMLLDQLPIGILIQNEHGILYANETACSFLGTSAEALVGQQLPDFLTPDQAATTAPIIGNAFLSSKQCRTSHVTIRLDGYNKRAVSITASKLPWEGDPVIQILLHDVTGLEKHERRMQAIMATDPLTGAQNRRSFMSYTQELKRLNLVHTYGLVLWDIDFFKQVNDTYGHPIGDIALQTLTIACEIPLARRALIECPDLPRPMLARVGGEEFAFILPGADAQETFSFAESFRQNVEKMSISTKDLTFSLTVSIGIVVGDLETSTIDTLMSLADKAMYAAKRNGRNQVRSANYSMQRPPIISPVRARG